MSQTAPAPSTYPVYKASTKRLAEPFANAVGVVFRRLELLLPEEPTHSSPQIGPSVETVVWAKQILLQVLPRKFLLGAQINSFEREIHVTWEDHEKGKRVVVFFPESKQLKIYHELVKNDAVVEHKLVNATSPCDVSERLRWFFQ